MRYLFASFTNPQVSFLDEAGIPIINGIKTVSRLNYKPDILPFCLKSEFVPSLRYSNLSFEQCCEQRISDLEKIKGKIYVMWSGGIDSSVILTSVIKYGSPGLKSKVIVVMSTDSYREFPQMFQLVCSQFPIINVYNSPESYLKDNDILITGELGDQLFGSDFIYTLASINNEHAVFDSYLNQVPQLFQKLAGFQKGNSLFDHIEPIVKECPYSIKTSFDFLWWWNFTQKWQHVKYRVLFLNFQNPSLYSDKVISFFDTLNFQEWSLSNSSEKIKTTLHSYKWTAKEYIINNTGFSYYSDKPKIGSLKKIKVLRPRRLAIMEDLSVVNEVHIFR